jgi:hypothetical protein
MNGIVVYESMYGNTRQVAEAIAAGLGGVAVVPVADATAERLAGADLVVVGGPTHMLGMTGPGSRRSAAAAAAKPDSGLSLEAGATGPGVREWLVSAHGGGVAAAAFDSKLPSRWAGRAARKIARGLRRRGFRLLDRPQSFFVDKHNQLLPGELDRARDWGVALAAKAQVPAAQQHGPH